MIFNLLQETIRGLVFQGQSLHARNSTNLGFNVGPDSVAVEVVGQKAERGAGRFPKRKAEIMRRGKRERLNYEGGAGNGKG
jgi:hypothetical protein